MLDLTIAIPTYRREGVLLDTLTHLLALYPAAAAEILVLDQTEARGAQSTRALQALADAGRIRWLRLPRPSITHAMNEALLRASHEVILFLDDDIRPEPALLTAHLSAQAAHPDGLVAGRVIQPWEETTDFANDSRFHFASLRSALIPEFMGGNFSIRRDLALRLGGFDENFIRVAYRFEAEFAHRFRADGRQIYFEPRACLHHLKAEAGGTRSYGEHLNTWRPDHAVGAYYHALRTRRPAVFFARPLRAACTRYHLSHPWRIPGSLFAEASGMAWAFLLFLRGPKYVACAGEKDGA